MRGTIGESEINKKKLEKEVNGGEYKKFDKLEGEMKDKYVRCRRRERGGQDVSNGVSGG